MGEAQRLARRREGRSAGGSAVGRRDQRAEVAGGQAAREARGRLDRAVLPNQTRQAVLRLARVRVRLRLRVRVRARGRGRPCCAWLGLGFGFGLG